MLGAPPPGGSVLVHGGGSGVGTAAISLCREAGLRILVTAGSAEKCQRCLEHGADVAINYRDGDFAPQVREATGGAGVNVVLDSIGARYLEGNLASLAVDGRLVVIGLMGGARAELDLARAAGAPPAGHRLDPAHPIGRRKGGDRRGVPRVASRLRSKPAACGR